MNKKKSAQDWFAEGYEYDVIQLNPQKAIEAYKESIKLDNRLTNAYVNLGFIYLEKEDYLVVQFFLVYLLISYFISCTISPYMRSFGCYRTAIIWITIYINRFMVNSIFF